MFVCEKCLEKDDIHSFFPISHGNCEICGEVKMCYEVYIH
jgi:hypothetical protein